MGPPAGYHDSAASKRNPPGFAGELQVPPRHGHPPAAPIGPGRGARPRTRKEVHTWVGGQGVGGHPRRQAGPPAAWHPAPARPETVLEAVAPYHLFTNSWKSWVKTPLGSLGGGCGRTERWRLDAQGWFWNHGERRLPVPRPRDSTALFGDPQKAPPLAPVLSRSSLERHPSPPRLPAASPPALPTRPGSSGLSWKGLASGSQLVVGGKDRAHPHFTDVCRTVWATCLRQGVGSTGGGGGAARYGFGPGSWGSRDTGAGAGTAVCGAKPPSGKAVGQRSR